MIQALTQFYFNVQEAAARVINSLKKNEFNTDDIYGVSNVGSSCCTFALALSATGARDIFIYSVFEVNIAE